MTQAHIVMTLTGHGQYADLQCGEFCQLRFKLHLDGHEIGTFDQETILCDRNPVHPQMGTWGTMRGPTRTETEMLILLSNINYSDTILTITH